MLIIPALDLKKNLVVRAAGGNRDLYQPLQAARFPCSDLPDVVGRMCESGKFKVFYIADLDAIENKRTNNRIIQEVSELYPNCEFWLDAGIKTATDLLKLSERFRCIPIVATETLADKTLPTKLRDGKLRWILSLDMRRSVQLGAPEIHADNTCWPDEVIFLSLGKVGSQRGPDLAEIAHAKTHTKNKKLIVGGGIRNLNDVLSAKKAGASGVLAASAIYEGTINQATALPTHHPVSDSTRENQEQI